MGQFRCALATLSPMSCQNNFHALMGQFVHQQLDFSVCVFGAVIDGHHTGKAVMVSNVIDMPLDVGNTRFKCLQVLLA